MLYTVTIDPLNATFFVSDQPNENEWEVQERVELEINPIYRNLDTRSGAAPPDPLCFDL